MIKTWQDRIKDGTDTLQAVSDEVMELRQCVKELREAGKLALEALKSEFSSDIADAITALQKAGIK